MEIKTTNINNQYVVAIEGRLDTNTAPELETVLNDVNASNLVLDCLALEYVSSAGLRVILAAHKRLSASGQSLTLKNIRQEVRAVFDMTGFSKILTIE
mgnify:FL=1